MTGGSSGIGLAVAQTLAEEGYRVTLAARRADALDAAVDVLLADGGEAQGIVTDVGVEGDIVDLVASHRDTYGRLDVLVNNAGVGTIQAIEQVSADQLDRQLAVNLRSIAIATREALPLLRAAGAEHGKALIVNTASLAGRTGLARAPVYAATKAAVINLTESTRLAVGADGVQCTALAPDFVDTPMTDFVKRQIPAEHMIQPGDLAEAVRFLLRTSTSCHVPQLFMTRRGEPVGAEPA